MMRRALFQAARQAGTRAPLASRNFAISARCRSDGDSKASTPSTHIKSLDEVKTADDLLAPGAPVGTVPTDFNQATGLERLEILGKMQGIDIFDMKPLDTSRKGTLQDPIIVRSFGHEQHIGCTGVPADSHELLWLRADRDRPIERCPECGNVIKMEYVGPEMGHDDHDHDHHATDSYPVKKTMADFIRPEYRSGL